MEFKDWLSSADNLTATMVASYLIFQGVRWLYARTLGRRRALKIKLDSLAFGNPEDNIEAAFGPSISFAALTGKFMRDKEGLLAEVQLEQRLYDVRYGFLTVYFCDGAVVAYAFTLRNVRFAYALELQSFDNLPDKLGRTTFEQFHRELPEMSDLTIGAQIVGYTEVYYFGRPGRYQHYGLSSTMLGKSKRHQLFVDVTPSDHAKLRELRATSMPDTFTVFGPQVAHEAWEGWWASGAIDHDRLVLLNKVNLRRSRRRWWKFFK